MGRGIVGTCRSFIIYLMEFGWLLNGAIFVYVLNLVGFNTDVYCCKNCIIPGETTIVLISYFLEWDLLQTENYLTSDIKGLKNVAIIILFDNREMVVIQTWKRFSNHDSSFNFSINSYKNVMKDWQNIQYKFHFTIV